MLEKYRDKEEYDQGMEKERILCNLARSGENSGVRESLKNALVELRNLPERGGNDTETALRYLVADIKGGQGEDCERLYTTNRGNYI